MMQLKNKTTHKHFSFFYVLNRYKWQSFLGLLSLLSVALATLLFPFLIRHFLDEGLLHKNSNELFIYFLSLLGAGIFLGCASAARIFCTHWLTQRLICDIEKMVYTHVLIQEPHFFRKHPLSSVFQLLFSDIARLKSLLSSSLSLTLRNSFLFLGAVVLMLHASFYFSFVISALILFIILPLAGLLRFLRRFSQGVQVSETALTHHMRESLDMAETVQSFLAEELEVNRLAHFMRLCFKKHLVYIALRALITALAFFISISVMVGVIWLGTLAVIHHTLSVGALVQFLIAAFIAATSLAALSESAVDFHIASQISQRLNTILGAGKPKVATLPRPADRKMMSSTTHDRMIFLNHVSFSYPNHENLNVLQDIFLSIKKNTMVGLVGPSGSGKSTLFSLILGFYKPTQGTIQVAGEQDRRLFRYHCTRVPQDSMLFNRSVFENIRYGCPQATLEHVRHVARLALIDDFINTLPEKYDTLCGERASRFSPGQRQRIAIARALLVEAPILLLDEVSSGLDAESEQALMYTLNSIRQERTILMISHRLNLMREVDTILFLREGRILLEGTHQTLASYDNPYKSFLEAQNLI